MWPFDLKSLCLVFYHRNTHKNGCNVFSLHLYKHLFSSLLVKLLNIKFTWAIRSTQPKLGIRKMVLESEVG